MKSKKIFAFIFLIIVFCIVGSAKAEDEESKNFEVNYNGQTVTDSDLDGLTDQAEVSNYLTDYKNPDTDSDGILDGTEVLQGTDSLDPADPGSLPAIIRNGTPWAWYAGRAAGLIGYVFLWLTIFLGLSIRNPLLKKIIAPVYSFDFHCFLGALAVFWGLVHGTVFLFDKNAGLGIADIAIPFFSKTTIVNVNYLGLGIVAFYAMAVMTITSYLRRHIKHIIWRILHFLNPFAFIFTVIHGMAIGTDMKNVYVQWAFLISANILTLVYLTSLFSAIWNKFRKSNTDMPSAVR